MTDKAAEHEETQNLEELRFSKTQSYFDKSITIKVIIALLFAIFLFVFLHFKQTYVETLELGSVAKNYVVSQVDFTFADEEATIISRQDAAIAIRAIYQIDPDEIEHRMNDFQKSFTHGTKDGKQFESVTDLGGVGDLASSFVVVGDTFSQARFTDPKTLARIEQLEREEKGGSTKHYYAFLSPIAEEDTYLPTEFWDQMARNLKKSGASPDLVHMILTGFQKNRWNVVVDRKVEYSLREQVQKEVAQKYTSVRSGERLIDRGERVTARHLLMIHAMKTAIDHQRNLLNPMTILGTALMTLLFVIVAIVYLRGNHKGIYYSNQKLALFVTIMLLTLAFAKLVELLLLNQMGDLMDLAQFPLFVPFAAILFSSLMNVRIAAFATIFLSVILALSLAVATTPFLVLNVLAAFVALLYARTIRRRKEVFVICAKVWAASIVIILAFELYENATLDLSFLTDLMGSFIFMGVTAVLVVGLLPIFESLFQILTDITLMEYMDPSNSLLRRLSIEVPGTYQHSIVVGNLAESAASAIGANGLFCRVAAQYHDIGKLANPQYFVENQLGGVDMHQLLTPSESAQVIIAHVSEGVVLARKHSLPEKFIDIIKEHHGTTLVYYFYHKEKELLEKEGKEVTLANFRYSGPKPRSKESTILMIADTLEAASRSLESFERASVSELVEVLVAQKMEDRQFDNSLLTFEELGVVKRVLINTLLAVSHPRIKYPPHHPGEEG